MGVFDIKYMPRTSIVGQVLADLVVEFTKCLAVVGTEEDEFVGVRFNNFCPRTSDLEALR